MSNQNPLKRMRHPMLRVERLEERAMLANDTINVATPLGSVSASPLSASDSIMPDTDVDMYSFSVLSGQVVDFDIDTPLNGTGGLGSYIRLFDAQGTQLAANNDAAAPGETLGFDAYLRYTFAIGTTYYLGVSNNTNDSYSPTNDDSDTSGGQHSTGSYQLTIRALPDDADDTLTSATLLGAISTTGNSTSNNIDPDTDVDLYRFTVSTEQVVDFDIDTPLNGPGGLGSYIRLFDSTGTELAANNDAAAPGETIGFDSYLRYTFATAGTYYLGVSNNINISYDPTTGEGDTEGGEFSIGSYQLIARAVLEDNDDTFATATSLGAITTTASSTSSEIDPDTDVDLYEFTVTAGQVVGFDINTPLNGPGGLGSYIRLFNSTGDELAANNDAAAPGETIGFDSYLRHTFAMAGTYYLGVSNSTNVNYDPTTGNDDMAGGQHSIGSYQLIVRIVPVDSDDTLITATSLGTITTTASSTSSGIDPDTDVDLYEFTITAGQVVDFDINTPLNGPDGLDTVIRLFDSTGTELTANNDAAAPGETIGFDSYLRYTFETPGLYYLGVSNQTNTFYDPITGDGDTAGGDHAVGSYQLVVRAIESMMGDPDDTVAEATSVGAVTQTPRMVSGTISPDLDVDVYSFDVSSGAMVEFDIDTVLNGSGGLDAYIRVFNSQGIELASNDNGANAGETLGFDSYLGHAFDTAGTFYIGVSNSTNSSYNVLTGDGDSVGGDNATGSYDMIINATSTTASTLSLAISPDSIPELGGVATGIVTRNDADLTGSLTVSLTSSNPENATVPASVVIAAGQMSADFQISGVRNPLIGTTTVTITAAATDFAAAIDSLQIEESDFLYHNFSNPADVDTEDGVTPVDALLVINYLNSGANGNLPTTPPPPYLDVDKDNVVTPVDALLVINELNDATRRVAGSTSSAASSSVLDAEYLDEAYSQLTSVTFSDSENRPSTALRHFDPFDWLYEAATE